MYRVRFLRHHGIEPFLVFDGGPLPAKKGTEVSRAKWVYSFTFFGVLDPQIQGPATRISGNKDCYLGQGWRTWKKLDH